MKILILTFFLLLSFSCTHKVKKRDRIPAFDSQNINTLSDRIILPNSLITNVDNDKIFHRNDLEKLIHTHKPNTIPELVNLLPLGFKKNRTEIFNSKSYFKYT